VVGHGVLWPASIANIGHCPRGSALALWRTSAFGCCVIVATAASSFGPLAGPFIVLAASWLGPCVPVAVISQTIVAMNLSGPPPGAHFMRPTVVAACSALPGFELARESPRVSTVLDRGVSIPSIATSVFGRCCFPRLCSLHLLSASRAYIRIM
jgi:hypothetical protein